MADFTGTSGVDTFSGSDGAADSFTFAVANLSSSDTVIGGSGTPIDLLAFSTSGTITSAMLAGVSGIERIQLFGSGTNAITLTNALAGGAYGAVLGVIGGSGNDTVDGSALTGANAIDVTSNGGNDIFKGGAGADIFRFTAGNLNASDTVQGGAGSDTLALSAAGTVASLAGVTGIETVTLANGTNGIKLLNSMVSTATGAKVAVIGGAGADTVDASGLTGANAVDVTSNGGNDVLKGGAGNDIFRFAPTGLDSSDVVQGGAGSDTLAITAAGTVTSLAGVTGIETVTLANGTNSIKPLNSMVSTANGAIVKVIGGTGADTVDGSGLTGANAIDATSNGGNDIFKGGTGNDIFRFAPTGLDANDVVQGGAGTDTLAITAAGTVTSLAGVSGVEKITLADGTNTLTLTDATVSTANNDKVTITGGAGNDTVDGSGLTGTDAINVTAGTGTDTLEGGAGNDTFHFAPQELTAADTVSGGAGSDTLMFDSTGPVGSLAGVTGIEAIILDDGNNSLALTNTLATSALNQSVSVTGDDGADTIDGSAVTATSSKLALNGGYGDDILTGGAGADTIIGGYGKDVLTGGGGADTISGGDGNDVIDGGLGADSLQGGTGNDTVTYDSGDTVIGGGAGTDILTGTTGGVFNLSNRADQSSGDAAVVTGFEDFDFQLAADNITITGTSGAEAIFTGAGNDVIDGKGGADEIFSGPGGSDTVFYYGSEQFIYGSRSQATLRMLAAADVDVTALDETPNDAVDVEGFQNIDASAATGDMNVTGDDAGDIITTGSGVNVITGGGGNDTIDGGAGADTIKAGGGDDRVWYDPSDVSNDGGADSSTQNQPSGDVLLVRGAANIDLGATDQSLGDNSNTTGYENVDASASTVSVTLKGGDVGASNFSILTGGSAADAITGGADFNFIFGGAGADTLTGGAGDENYFVYRATSDFVSGETISGSQTGSNYLYTLHDSSVDYSGFSYSNIDGVVLDTDATATMTGAQAAALSLVQGSQESETFIVNLAPSTTTDLSQISVAYLENFIINGTSGADTVIIPDYAVTFHGGNGDDVVESSDLGYSDGTGNAPTAVFGDAGNDRISYTSAATSAGGTLDGGADNDTLVGNTNSYATIELASAYDQSDNDGLTVKNFENVDWSAAGSAVNVRGSTGTNTLIGSGYDDTIDGKGGADVVQGGAGHDSITYYAAAASTDGGADTDALIVKGAATINLNAGDQSINDGNVVTGFEDVDATRSSSAVVLTGSDSFYSTLRGGSGNDTITAGAFGATIGGGAGADTLTSTTANDLFYILSGDWAPGDTINSQGDDTLDIGGDADLTTGSIGRLARLQVGALALSGTGALAALTQDDGDTTVTLSGTQAAGIGTIGAGNNPGFAETINIKLTAGVATDLSTIGWAGFEPGIDQVNITGSGGNDTLAAAPFIVSVVNMGAGNDTVYGTGFQSLYYEDGTQVLGGAGNDSISYLSTANVTLDGGADSDTLLGFGTDSATINLSQTADQTVGDAATVQNFENVSWGASGAATITGSNGVNTLAGGSASDTINGSGGNDILDGGSGGSIDTLTGGTGADKFRWLARDNALDVVTDFKVSDGDKLDFASAGFDYNGTAFSTKVVATSTATDITGADLVLYSGGTLNSVADAQTYLNAAAGGSVDEGLFIAGTNSAGHTVLYHALDASYTDSTNVAAVADLGTSVSLSQLSTSLFEFV